MKNDCSDYVVFHCIINFSDFFLNICTKRIHEAYNLLKLHTHAIPNYDYFVSFSNSYFGSNRFYSNVRTSFFSLC